MYILIYNAVCAFLLTEARATQWTELLFRIQLLFPFSALSFIICALKISLFVFFLHNPHRDPKEAQDNREARISLAQITVG